MAENLEQEASYGQSDRPNNSSENFMALNVNSTQIIEDPKTGVTYSKTNGGMEEVPVGTILYANRPELIPGDRKVEMQAYATHYIDESGRKIPLTQEGKEIDLPPVVRRRILEALGGVTAPVVDNEPESFDAGYSPDQDAAKTGSGHLSVSTLSGKPNYVTNSMAGQGNSDGDEFNRDAPLRGRRHKSE